MKVKAKNYQHLKDSLEGFSKEQITAHLDLYEGYVNALNEIEKALPESDRDETHYAYGAYTELKRRYAVALDGMVLHELYFENLKKTEEKPSKDLERLFFRRWGGFKNWENDFKATAKAGPGWIVTGVNPDWNVVENFLITEHHIGWPLGFDPVIVLDVWEHAFTLDFGMDKESYFKAFLNNLNWERVNKREQMSRVQNEIAMKHSPELRMHDREIHEALAS